MAAHRVQVAIGEGVVARAPHTISSLGLGSCVAVILYDAQRRIGGLAHIMLPDSASVHGRRTSYQCADTAIATLLKRLRSNGAARQDIVAKIVGGARMFSFYEDSNTSIGEQNIRSVRHILRTEQIPLVGEDTGGRHGRSVEFHLDSGRVIVTAIGKEDREV
jgi:chemotaxis protein CheD